MFATGTPKNELQYGCTRFLSYSGNPSPARQLRELAEYCEERGLRRDTYGSGDDLQAFEARIAQDLGYASAVFMPSGTMAQQIALRIWADRAENPRVGFHATSHLEANEELAYRHLHGLEATHLGEPSELLLASAIEEGERLLAARSQKLSAVLVELPMRRLGGVLPSWAELQKIKQIAREKGIKLHLDGARLWECGPFYARPYREICDGFDSAYVSFYKGLGGLTGAMLCGPADFVETARTWQRRHGGNLYQLTPYWVSALRVYEKNLGSFEKRYERTLRLARAIEKIPGITLRPRVPHTPLLHVLIEARCEALSEARDTIAREDSFWLGGRFYPAAPDSSSLLEVAVEDAALGLSDLEIRHAFEKLVRLTQTRG